MRVQNKFMIAVSFVFMMLFSAILAVGNYLLARFETINLEKAFSESSYMKIGDLKLHYVEKGNDGKSIILVHGFGGSAYSWRKNIDSLAQSFKVYAIDLFGFGYSTRVTTRDYSTKKHAETIKWFMDSLGLDKASMVGNSLGAEVVLQFAIAHPNCVEKLVLIDGPPFHSGGSPFYFVAGIPLMNKALLYYFFLNPRSAENIYRSAYFNSDLLTAEEIERSLRPLHVKGTSDALIAMTLSKLTPLNFSRVPGVETLIIWGQEDDFINVEQASKLRMALPNSEMVIVENAGHVPHEEKPDQVNNLLVQFLSN